MDLSGRLHQCQCCCEGEMLEFGNSECGIESAAKPLRTDNTIDHRNLAWNGNIFDMDIPTATPEERAPEIDDPEFVEIDYDDEVKSVLSEDRVRERYNGLYNSNGDEMDQPMEGPHFVNPTRGQNLVRWTHPGKSFYSA